MAEKFKRNLNGVFERVVKPGDTLSGIAAESGTTLRQVLLDNPQFQSNPNLIFPGQKVNLQQYGQQNDRLQIGGDNGFMESEAQAAARRAELAKPTNNAGYYPPPPPMGGASPSPTPPITDPISGQGGTDLPPNPSPGNGVPPGSPGGSGSPVDNFNMLLFDLLKRGQGVDTLELERRRNALRKAQINKSSEITPEELRTLSPSQQQAIRNADIKALEPDIEENAYQLEKANRTIKNFEEMFDKATKLGSEFADKMVAPDSVIESAKMIIQDDPERMSEVLGALNDRSKQEVIGRLDYSKMKKKKDPFELSPGQTRYEYDDMGVPQKVASVPPTSSTTSANFTSQEKRKLEQAGLSNAPRQEQLDYLYGKGEDEYAFAEDYVKKNFALGEAQLRSDLQQMTDLGASEINAILATSGFSSDNKPLSEEDMRAIAIRLVKQHDPLLSGKGEVDKAKAYIDGIPVGEAVDIVLADGTEKQMPLNQIQKDRIKQLIDEIYGSDRSIWSRLPWVEN